MTKDRSQTFSGIEEVQAELRRSIERAKALAAESDRRIRRSREPPSQPRS